MRDYTQDEQLQRLFDPIRSQLRQSGDAAMHENWCMPMVTGPLSEEDVHFLRAHTLADLVAQPSVSEDNPLKQFLLSVLKGVLTEVTQHFTREMLAPAASTSLTEIPTAKPTADPLAIPDFSAVFLEEKFPLLTASKEASAKQAPSLLVGQSLFSEHLPIQGAAHNPELETMRRIAAHRAAKTTMRIGKELLNDSLQQLTPTNAEFARHIIKEVSRGVKAGVFMTQVAERGFVPVLGELVKNEVINKAVDLAVKKPLEIGLRALSLSNPAGVAYHIVSGIKDVLQPTETAPQWLDLPLDPSDHLMPLSPIVPLLDPSYSAIRPPK